MAFRQIKLGPILESGQERLSGAAPVAVNVIIDKRGTVMRRPGIATYAEAPTSVIDSTGIEALHVTRADKLYAIGGYDAGHGVWKIDSGTATSLSGVANGRIQGTKRPVLTETMALMPVTCGTIPYKMVLSTEQVGLLGSGNPLPTGDGPPRCSHIIGNASRLLANDVLYDKTKVSYSNLSVSDTDYTGHEQWAITPNTLLAGYFGTESAIDNVVALIEHGNTVVAFCNNNMQSFMPDASWSYALAGVLEFGCLAPYSIVSMDSKFALLDQRRRFILTEGDEPQVLSDAIQSDLDGLTSPSDCYGYRVKQGPIDCMVWTFPTDGVTYALQAGGGWSQWRDTRNGSANMNIGCVETRASDGTTIVGLTDGRIGQLRLDTHTDLGGDIVASVTTGYENNGTDAVKVCKGLYLTVKRGDAGDDPQGAVRVSWSDTYGHWKRPLYITLGETKSEEATVQLRGLGTYRQRAWRFELTGSGNYKIISAQEEYGPDPT